MEKSNTELRRIHNVIKKQNDEKYRNNSKKRLMENITRKFKTTMIGALSHFEKEFGHLWAHGDPLEYLTPDQKEWRDIWEDVRTAILNNGNNQLRATLDEIAQYTMTWDRYQTQFIIKKQEKY